MNNNFFGFDINKCSKSTWYVEGYDGIVSCSNKYASDEVINCLKNGGNAFDASVVCMSILGLANPGNCGIGGGGYANIYNASTQRIETLDFREVAPIKTNPYCFVDSNNIPVPFFIRRQQGNSVGVPGVPMFWKVLLERYGTWTLKKCLEPAIDLSNKGIVVDETFNAYVTREKNIISNFTTSRELYFDSDGNPVPVGYIFRNPDYAKTLYLIGKTNTEAFYTGEIAEDIVKCVQNPPTIPFPSVEIKGGVMEMEDLSLYQVLIKPPIKSKFRDVDIFSVPPSTSGGIIIAEGLGIYEQLMPSGSFNNSPESLADGYYNRLMAMKYSFADRNKYVSDPLFYTVPTDGLVDASYIKSRASIIPNLQNQKINEKVLPGIPPNTYININPVNPPNEQSKDPTSIFGSTTGFIIVDKFGNISCITFTIEEIFGSGMTVPGRGFLLNNELTDFNVLAFGQNEEPNSPAPLKRPRSSMIPTIIFRNEKPLLALSCAGGSAIPITIFNAIIDFIDYNYTIQNSLLEGRYFQVNSIITSTDSQATAQKSNLGSLFSLLTTYSTISPNDFVFADENADPISNLAMVSFNNRLLKAGFNWPKTISKIFGGCRAVNQTFSENTGEWISPLDLHN
jgi:gamma-glutamyltranspeptidase/glutathione hydrolase